MKPYFKTCAEVDLSALAHNYKTIEQAVHAHTPGCRLLCIVKADAYGHGALRSVETLLACGASFFGVATIGEALTLRAHFPTPDILILGYTEPDLAEQLIDNNLTQTVFSEEYAYALHEYIPAGKRLTAHLKLDTGMNRIGFSGDSEGVAAAIACCKATADRIDYQGLFTHFACSDEADTAMTDRQIAHYEAALATFRANGIDFAVRHMCNSAGALCYPAAHGNLVRCGLILYGLTPSEAVPDPGLRPVMAWKTTISQIHVAKKGETVSYGATFQAQRDTRIATLPIGYADGFIRAYSGASVMIHGFRAPIIGRICMDQCMVDITDYHGDTPIETGDEVVLFGQDKPITELSDCAGTISYETLCLISSRVPRVYSN